MSLFFWLAGRCTCIYCGTQAKGFRGILCKYMYSTVSPLARIENSCVAVSVCVWLGKNVWWKKVEQTVLARGQTENNNSI